MRLARLERIVRIAHLNFTYCTYCTSCDVMQRNGMQCKCNVCMYVCLLDLEG